LLLAKPVLNGDSNGGLPMGDLAGSKRPLLAEAAFVRCDFERRKLVGSGHNAGRPGAGGKVKNVGFSDTPAPAHIPVLLSQRLGLRAGRRESTQFRQQVATGTGS
jgi:hypothetical protein